MKVILSTGKEFEIEALTRAQVIDVCASNEYEQLEPTADRAAHLAHMGRVIKARTHTVSRSLQNAGGEEQEVYDKLKLISVPELNELLDHITALSLVDGKSERIC